MQTLSTSGRRPIDVRVRRYNCTHMFIIIFMLVNDLIIIDKKKKKRYAM